MKTYHLTEFLGRCVSDARPGHGKRVLLTFCAGAVLLFGVTDILARGFARAGGGARGVGVAPGVSVGSPGYGALPNGYVRTVPVGYTTVVYNGSTCYYANGAYYCPVFYQGTTVYVMTQ